MNLRAIALALTFAAGSASAMAEPYAPWGDEPFWDRPAPRNDRRDREFAPTPPARQSALPNEVRDGGPRPEIAPRAPIVVAFPLDEYAAGSIVIDSGGRRLYFVLPGNRAFQYPISVGREGFAWAGTEKISRKQAWPDWHPPTEMRKRDPKLPAKMLGGVKNPLGAMALYLGNTLYRIHGTNDEKTIGHASSSGCFRMMNSAVLHLAQFAQVGTPVTVVNKLPIAPAPPPIASVREPAPAAVRQPPIAQPPVVANRPVRVPPPETYAEPNTWGEEDRDVEPQQAEPRGFDDRDVADVTVTPRRDVDDYDPYVARRPFGDRYGRSRYRDSYASRRGSLDSYDTERPRGGRVWYDDERDDY